MLLDQAVIALSGLVRSASVRSTMRCIIGAGLSAGLIALLSACSRPAPAPAPVVTSELAARSVIPDTEARDCARCHPKAYEAWLPSQHAQANRRVDAQADGAAFALNTILIHGDVATQVRREGGAFTFRYAFSNEAPQHFTAEAVIGITPLRQYLVGFPGGRLQAMDAAYDPRSNAWFHVFPEARQPHEWGHWKGRSMTWNVQCAFCHMTDFQKNYDPASDSYASTWKAMGISCTQCHVIHTPSARTLNECPVTNAAPAVTNASTHMENCASCHARREELTGAFRAGERFEEHYRLALPDQPGLYYADGQVREEDFEYGSFRLSRMGHRGVTCLDCHDPHSGKLKLPAENNALCMSCHLAPGQRGAAPVDPATHSHHAPGTVGDRCIDCHMPVTHYMVRDPRRDHGFTIPDPTLTRELGIPNACSRCHTNQTTEWSEQWTDRWYGQRMERPTRHRARLVARAWSGDPTVVSNLLAAAAAEEIPAWRATLTSLLAPWQNQPAVRAFLETQLRDPEPLVRSAAVRVLAQTQDTYALLKSVRRDSARLVRLDAALSTANQLESDPTQAQEVAAYLRTICDQPAGALRNAEFALAMGRPKDAETWARRAAQWDTSAEPQFALGHVLYRANRIAEAVEAFARATQLDTQVADYPFSLALAQAEAGHSQEALAALQETVRREPDHGRAWYNLGLAYSGQGQLSQAVDALRRAEALLPGSPDAAYALATVYARMERPDEARATALRVLSVAPHHAPAQRLLMSLSRTP